MLGLNSRKSLVKIEVALLVFAVANWIIQPDEIFTPIMLLPAYATGLITRYGDSKKVW